MIRRSVAATYKSARARLACCSAAATDVAFIGATMTPTTNGCCCRRRMYSRLALHAGNGCSRWQCRHTHDSVHGLRQSRHVMSWLASTFDALRRAGQSDGQLQALTTEWTTWTEKRPVAATTNARSVSVRRLWDVVMCEVTHSFKQLQKCKKMINTKFLTKRKRITFATFCQPGYL